MTVNFRIWEQGQIVDLLNNATDAAGRTSTYVTLNNAEKAYIICKVTQGNATPVAWSVLQATAAAGTGSKAVTAMPIVANEDTSVSDALVVQANAVSYTNTAALKNKVVVFEIDPAQSCDINGGFNHIAVSTGASNAANLTSAQLILMPIKNQMQTPPTTTGV